MKKGIIVNLKHFRVLDYVTLNKIFIILCLLFISGIVIGCHVFINTDWLYNFVKTYFAKFIDLHTDCTFLKKLFFSFIRYLSVLIVYFLSGTSMLGVVLIPFIMTWQGIAIGSISSFIYKAHGINGIAFNAIVLIPPCVVFVICCFFAAKLSIDFSLTIAKLTLPRSKPASLYICFKDYTIKYLIFVGVSLVCSVLEIVLNLCFLKFFNF